MYIFALIVERRYKMSVRIPVIGCTKKGCVTSALLLLRNYEVRDGVEIYVVAEEDIAEVIEEVFGENGKRKDV